MSLWFWLVVSPCIVSGVPKVGLSSRKLWRSLHTRERIAVSLLFFSKACWSYLLFYMPDFPDSVSANQKEKGTRVFLLPCFLTKNPDKSSLLASQAYAESTLFQASERL